MREDLKAQLLFDANRKSVSAAYILWIFLGSFGAHRFYLGRTGTGAVQLALLLLGWLPLFAGWIVLGIWLFVDLFLIPGIAANQNTRLAYEVMR